MLSTIYVITAQDNANNDAPTVGSLRAAILQADAQPAGTSTTIDFRIGIGPQLTRTDLIHREIRPASRGRSR